MSTPQVIVSQLLERLAPSWPWELVDRAQAAIDDADPDGLNAFAYEPDWYAAIDDALGAVPQNDRERELIAKLREVTSPARSRSAAGYTVGQAAGDFAGGVADDVIGARDVVVKGTKKAFPVGLALGIAGGLWYLFGGRRR